MSPVLLHDRKRCVGCGGCVPACPNGALSLHGDKALVDRTRCQNCGSCVSVCPVGANTLSGRAMTLSEILAVVCRDKPYYEATGGGLTLSGGEPLLQPAAVDLLAMAKAAGISTWVETTACLPWERLVTAARYTDGFYVDFKHSDADTLYRATGARLALLEENLRRLVQTGAQVTLRTPVIPGFNDSEAVLAACFAFARSLGLSRYVLLPYHSLGSGKYKKLDLPCPLENVSALKPEDLSGFAELGASMGLSVQIGG